MNEREKSTGADSERPDQPAEAEGAEKLIERARRKSGGPDVDYTALCAFVGDELPDEKAKVTVQRFIDTFQQWHEAYRKLVDETEPRESRDS